MQTLVAAPQGQEFRLRDGSLLKDTQSLFRALTLMSEDEFNSYVHGETNHFATWIDHCLNDKFLAAALRRSSSREGMLKKLFIHVFS